ncbi:MAG: hypothetical protein AAGF31_12950 [Planctomycetota bacterium]
MPKTINVELRRPMKIGGKQFPAGAKVGTITTEEPFDPNFLIDGMRTSVCGECHEPKAPAKKTPKAAAKKKAEGNKNGPKTPATPPKDDDKTTEGEAS